jgi:hypothetical protein
MIKMLHLFLQLPLPVFEVAIIHEQGGDVFRLRAVTWERFKVGRACDSIAVMPDQPRRKRRALQSREFE